MKILIILLASIAIFTGCDKKKTEAIVMDVTEVAKDVEKLEQDISSKDVPVSTVS